MLSSKEINSRINGENKVITGARFKNQLAYDLIMKNTQEIGNRKFVSIPLELLEIDETYQRINYISKDKVKSLISNFDMNKCDPILVSPHPETCTFAVINGCHRMIAAEVLKYSDICAVLATNLPTEPEARRIKEAELFCEQNIHVDHMAPAHKHKAYVAMGVKKYVTLDECVKGRKLLLNIHELKNMDKEKQDELKAEGYKVLSGYSAALITAGHTNGREVLNTVFDIIETTSWHYAAGGYGAYVIKVLSSMVNLYDMDPVITQAIINVLTPMEPKIFLSKSLAKYPGRRESEAMLMFLDQEVATLLKKEPKYTGGDLRKLTIVLNRKRDLEKDKSAKSATA